MIKIVHNLETNQIYEIELTKEEMAEGAAYYAKVEADKEEVLAKEAAREVILNRLGISADEAKLLLGL